MLVLSLLAFKNKKYTAYDHFHGNGAYGEIPTKKEPIRTIGFTLPYNNCCLFERLFRVKKNGVFLFGISFRFRDIHDFVLCK